MSGFVREKMTSQASFKTLCSSILILCLIETKITWPEMTDIINILIRCKFAYHVEFGFVCEYEIVLRDVVNRKLCKFFSEFSPCR